MVLLNKRGRLSEGWTCWDIKGCLLTKSSTSSGSEVDTFMPLALRVSVIHCRKKKPKRVRRGGEDEQVIRHDVGCRETFLAHL